MDYHLLRNSLPLSDLRAYGTDRTGSEYILHSSATYRVLAMDDIIDHLKLDSSNLESDSYYNTLIDAATMTAENIIRQDLIEKTYHLYMNYLPGEFHLYRHPIQAVNSIEYLYTDTNSWVIIDPELYYLTKAQYYPKIKLFRNKNWPTILSDQDHNIRVSLLVGYSRDKAIPDDLRLALLNHIAVLHEQRGDWGSADINTASLIQTLPNFSRLVYGRYRITNRK